MANLEKKDRIAKLHKEVDSKVLVKITANNVAIGVIKTNVEITINEMNKFRHNTK